MGIYLGEFAQILNKVITNTTVETSLLNLTANTSKSWNSDILAVGRTFLIKLRGFASRQGGNVTIKIKLGSTIIATTGSVNPSSLNNDMFEIDFLFTVRSIGVNGKIIGQGLFKNFSDNSTLQIKNTVETTINTTILNAFDITWQWATANVGNTVTSTNLILITK